MPFAKSRANSPLGRISDIKPVGKRLPTLSEVVNPSKTQLEHSCANFIEVMDKELKNLEDDLQQAKEKQNELLSRKENMLKNLDVKLSEKEALLKECQEVKPDLFTCSFEEKVMPTTKDEKYVLPFQVEDAKKPSSLYEKVVREFIKMRNLNYKYAVLFADELDRNKRLEEILGIVYGAKRHKGSIYFLNKIKALESEIAETKLVTDELEKKTNENIGSCWERAANIYGPKMRELLEKKGNLENEFIDKEAKLKELEDSEALLDKEITARKAKLERQTEINRLDF